MTRILKAMKLQMNKPDVAFVAPVGIVLASALISAIVFLAMQRAGLDPSDPSYEQYARQNTSITYALPGFLGYFGVQAISTTFPIAMAFGHTRRSFVFGTVLANLFQSAFIALMVLALLGLERATNHWGANMYIFDVWVLGSGDPLRLFATVLLGSFTILSIAGLFAAVWVKAGSKGPLIFGAVLVLVVAGGVLMAAPHFAEIIAWFTGLKAALIAIGLSVAAVLATWFAMRRTSVR